MLSNLEGYFNTVFQQMKMRYILLFVHTYLFCVYMYVCRLLRRDQMTTLKQLASTTQAHLNSPI